MVNIVMIVRDRQTLTSQSLGSLQQNTCSEDYNLTVIDDASKEKINYDTTFTNSYILRTPQPYGVGGSRNLGIKASLNIFGRSTKGGTPHLLYLSDNDVYFTPGWLEALSGLLLCHPTWKIIGGWNHPYHQPTERMKIAPARIGEPWRELWTQGAVAGVSWMLSWDTWDKFGPFDANARGVRQSEDTAFCQRVTAAGFRVGCVWPHVVYHTGVTDTFGQAPPGAELFKRKEGVLYQ